jgi:hypothetical protein
LAGWPQNIKAEQFEIAACASNAMGVCTENVVRIDLEEESFKRRPQWSR